LRTTYQESLSYSIFTSRYPGKTFFWTICFLPPLISITSSIGMWTRKILPSICIVWMRDSRLAFTLFS